MTPKQKAIELVNKYLQIYDGRVIQAKQCALIAVNEVLYVLNEIDSSKQWNASYFYNQVKQEIENQ